MLGKDGDLKDFNSLRVGDKDLTVFTIENLVLSEDKNRILMRIVLKRKITTEMLTTFLPTILLLLITFTSILFDKELFGDALAVNLTIILLMTTIFVSKIEELVVLTNISYGSLHLKTFIIIKKFYSMFQC